MNPSLTYRAALQASVDLGNCLVSYLSMRICLNILHLIFPFHLLFLSPESVILNDFKLNKICEQTELKSRKVNILQRHVDPVIASLQIV